MQIIFISHNIYSFSRLRIEFTRARAYPSRTNINQRKVIFCIYVFSHLFGIGPTAWIRERAGVVCVRADVMHRIESASEKIRHLTTNTKWHDKHREHAFTLTQTMIDRLKYVQRTRGSSVSADSSHTHVPLQQEYEHTWNTTEHCEAMVLPLVLWLPIGAYLFPNELICDVNTDHKVI